MHAKRLSTHVGRLQHVWVLQWLLCNYAQLADTACTVHHVLRDN